LVILFGGSAGQQDEMLHDFGSAPELALDRRGGSAFNSSAVSSP
jgi:hypothetical protein